MIEQFSNLAVFMENFIFSHVIIAVAFPPTPDGNEDPEAVKVKPIE